MSLRSEDARRVQVDLRAQISRLEDRAVLLEGERSTISYGALVEVCPKAVARLAKINTELGTLDHDAAALRAALAEADRRHEAAKTVEQLEGERKRGKEALRLGREMTDLAKELDRTALKLFADVAALRVVMVRLGALGAAPAAIMIDNAARRALATHAMGSKLQLEFLAPTSRKTWADFAAAWGTQVQAWAARRMGAPATKIEEAA